MFSTKHPNYYKFLKAPTVEQIAAVIKKSGVTAKQFERFHHIPENVIPLVNGGHRNMPVKFWHLFLDDPNPQSAPVAKRPPIPKEKKRAKKRIPIEGL